MKHADIITKLTLEQKCALLSGETVFTTRGYKNAGIPSITLSDGPNGVRKQAGAADHLGLNPSVPATCFPTAATVACSWDPALGEQLGRAMGEEAAAQEVSVLLGPGLNTKRSPASPPAPSTSPSTARSCAAWRRTPSSTSEPCGNST